MSKVSIYIVRRKSVLIFLIAAVTATAAAVWAYPVSGISYKNIMLDYQKTYSHYAPEGMHSDTESYAWDDTLGTTNEEKLANNLARRHANCEDCHDAHSATSSASPLGSFFGAGTQANVSGVKPLYWTGAGTAITIINGPAQITVANAAGSGITTGSSIVIDPNDSPHNMQFVTVTEANGNLLTLSANLDAKHAETTCTVKKMTVAAGEAPPFAFVASVVKEYELCYKCHSSYSFNYDLYQSTYGRELAFNWTMHRYAVTDDYVDPARLNDVLVTQTDTAKEFNPLNQSYHPVVAKGPILGTKVLPWAENRTFDETFMPGYSADSYIKCSDCHTSDTSGIKGPHGSENKYILKRPAPTTEPKLTFTNFNLGGYTYGYRAAYNMTWYVRTNNIICYECHSTEYYGPGRGHPSRGKHWTNCQWHRPVSLDEVGCASCKLTPVHGSPTSPYLMIFAANADDPNDKSWCYNCHNKTPNQPIPGRYIGNWPTWPSCPRFYSIDEDGIEQEETRVHFQSAVIKAGSEYFVPLPTPDMPNLKGLGNVPEYRYYNRDDDYILFKYGAPKEENGSYKIRFDQPAAGDRPDGEPVAEVGYEDSIALRTVDHAKDTQVYVSVDGDVIATKSLRTAKRVTDNLGNDITDVINTRTSNKDDRSGWFQGAVGYGNTISEIYNAGNSFVMDFGDLSRAKTIKLVWGVNEEKGGKLPVLLQTKDGKGDWVTRGSARHSEDRYGFIDLKQYFPKGTKDYKIKVIPTLNSIDFMAVSTKDESAKVTNLTLKKADFRKAGSGQVTDVTAALAGTDRNYVTFDYMDTTDLFFDIPAKDKILTKRDFIFCPTGYYETGGDIPEGVELAPMTAEKAQDFGVLTPAGGFANHYNVQMVDPGEWNERYADWIAK